MDKKLTVYPIPAGNELNVFANADINEMKIMDMAGNVVYQGGSACSGCSVVNIKHLPRATYIVEVSFNNNTTGRSVFVKL